MTERGDISTNIRKNCFVYRDEEGESCGVKVIQSLEEVETNFKYKRPVVDVSATLEFMSDEEKNLIAENLVCGGNASSMVHEIVQYFEDADSGGRGVC